MSELNREIMESVASAQRAFAFEAGVSLGIADIGVVLEEIIVRAVVRQLGPLSELRKQLRGSEPHVRAAVVARIESALRSMDEHFVSELCAHPEVEVSSASLGGLLADSPAFGEFGVRIAQRAFERVLGERVAPALRQRWAMSIEERSTELPGEFTHAIVFGELVGAIEEIFPLVLDAYAVDMKRGGQVRLNIVGVYVGWLDEHERATRIFYYKHATSELYEATLAEPLEFQSCQLLYLGSDETRLHKELARRLGSRLLFNASDVSRRCDDKFRAAQILIEKQVRTPVTAVLRANDGSNCIPEMLEFYGLSRCRALVLQPNGGTEGNGAQVVAVDWRDAHSVRTLVGHIERYWIEGTIEVLVREKVDCIRLEESGIARATCVRVNVVWDGHRSQAESGYVQIAGDSEPDIASVGRGGTIAPLSSGILRRLNISQVEFAQVRIAATAAVSAIVKAVEPPSVDVGLYGVDLLLESRAGKLLVWVLEINSRPAGLSHSDLLETCEPGVSTTLFEALLDRLMDIHGGAKSSEPNRRKMDTLGTIEERYLGQYDTRSQ